MRQGAKMTIVLAVVLFAVSLFFTVGAIRAYPPGTHRGVYLRASSWTNILMGLTVGIGGAIGGVFLLLS